MKIKLFQFKKNHLGYSFIFILFTILLGLIFFYFSTSQIKEVKGQTGCQTHNVAGWAWAENIGWISMSCENMGGSVDYGVDIDSRGRFRGEAWSENIGWIKFNRQTGFPYSSEYNHAARIVGYENGEYLIGGWANILSYGDGQGWIKFRSESGATHPYGAKINVSGRNWDSYAWSWAGEYGGVYYDGIGWIRWKNVGLTQYYAEYKAPWIQAEFGDIYAKGDVGSEKTFAPPPEPPYTYYNATYLIQSNGSVVNFTCDITKVPACEDFYEFEDILYFPQGLNRYTNVLGKIDYEGITTIVSGGKNKYGHPVEEYEISPPNFGGAIELNNTVYHFLGDLTVNNDVSFQPGSSMEDNNGSGLIVVDGDLHIDANITYALPGFGPQSIKYLPSAGFLVLGDIIINPSVTKLAGVFIATGDHEGSTGRISTGNSNSLLEVSGLMMARSFNFQRWGIGTGNQPSEKVIYDGRMIANPPPGFRDLAKALPVWREIAP